jgi:hypothetical protein
MPACSRHPSVCAGAAIPLTNQSIAFFLILTSVSISVRSLLMNRSLKSLVQSAAMVAVVTVTLSAIAVPAFASTVALWDFQTVTSGTAGTAAPIVGTGTVSPFGGAVNTGFNSGSGSSDPVQPGFGYQTDTYPAQSTFSGTRGVRIDVPTTGFSGPTFTGLEVSFDLRTSNTSGRWFRLDHTLDSGTNWVLGSPQRMGGSAANVGDVFNNNNQALINDPAALNNPLFGFRVVSVFSPNAFTQVNGNISYAPNTAYEVARNPLVGTNSAYAGGTWRFDMVKVTAVPEPSTLAMGGTAALALVGVIRRRIRKSA